jgi:alkyldihydroxyacetonephosphate synthase
VSGRRHKHWGWGFEDEQPDGEQLSAAARGLAQHLGFGERVPELPVPLEQVSLASPRVGIPSALRSICSDERHERASHAWGKSYSDVVRGFRGRFDHPPDFVARPRAESDLERVLEWCGAERVAAIPFGGGTSVVGGVEPNVGTGYNGAVTIDLGALDAVLEVDAVSRSALIQAGASGPRLEAQLAEHGLTLRHFPQSFQFSTLGGWIATRAAGHFATVWTHIEDLVESVRAITPVGAWESRRLPGSGAGVSPDRMLAGSEGTLGVITQAWVRVQPRPIHRAGCAVHFAEFAAGARCVRELSQAGLHPANCRLIDDREARLTLAGDGSASLLVLGFESTDHPVQASMERALALCREHGGVAPPRATGAASSAGEEAVGGWREAFLRAPYVRDVMVAMGVLSETFETAITWERFDSFHHQVMEVASEAVLTATGAQVGAGPGQAHVSCRLTHVYPDGPAPYFTIVAPARRGAELEQWAQIKAAVSDAVIAAGGTITHHHAVGRDHRRWYDRQRPEPFALGMRAAKAALDPRAILKPGVLFDPA